MTRGFGWVASFAAVLGMAYVFVFRNRQNQEDEEEGSGGQLEIRQELSRMTEATVLRLYSDIDRARERLRNLMPSSSSRFQDPTAAWDQFRQSLKTEKIDPDCFRSVPDIIRNCQVQEGTPYECEEHVCETGDGFLLTLHRMPRPGGQAVLLQHGILADSGNWVCGGPEQGLAFALWTAGFDVYMGNSRGNPYSRKHKTLDPKDSDFWKWSFQDLAKFDVPAMVDKVREVSGNEKVWFIGHSQGSLIAFAALSEDSNGELDAKLHGLIGLAPVFALSHVKGPWRIFCPMIGKLISSKVISPNLEFLPNTRAGRWMAKMATISPESMKNFGFRSARNLLLIWANFDPGRYFRRRLQVFLSHTPAGTSFRNIIHFAQNIGGGGGGMRKLDHGKAELNLRHYGSEKPPAYDFAKIKTDMHLFVGTNDWLATQEDVLNYLNQIDGQTQPKVTSYWSDDDHLDFIWGAESQIRLYPKLIAILKATSTDTLNTHSSNASL